MLYAGAVLVQDVIFRKQSMHGIHAIIEWKKEMNSDDIVDLFISVLWTILAAGVVTAIIIVIWFLLPYSIIFVIAFVLLLPFVIKLVRFM